MSAGSLALTNNSDVVPGTGTAFSTELVSGDFVVVTVGGITYTLPVKSVDSNSQITLISKYQGPSQSAVAWYAVPRATQNQVTAALVAQTTEALRGLNSDKQNWQAVFSDSGDITVILPDGSTFSGPSWKKIVELLNSVDLDAIQSLAEQIHIDAQQVAADRLDVDAKAEQASTDASTASAASASAVSANTSAQSAKTAAQTAQQLAEEARDAAQEANPTLQLTKSANLSDLSDIQVARANLGVYSKAEVDLRSASFIRGLDVKIWYESGNVITVSPGAAYIPSLGSVLDVPASLTLTATGLVASTWYYVYLYSNAGTPAIEFSTTAPVTYAAPGRTKTGDNSRRLLSCFRTTAANEVLLCMTVNGVCRYLVDYGVYCRILSGGQATSETAVVISSFVPSIASMVNLQLFNASTSAVFVYTQSGGQAVTVRPNGYNDDLPVVNYPNIYYRYVAAPGSASAYIDIGGYSFER
ncbi:hypothetical protein WKI40_23055 [Kosakonia sacchari]|uniref:hypothetical protein n=1 Tax=Kosakonia sacchari TaxID=1158459 RepID=UPI0030C37824